MSLKQIVGQEKALHILFGLLKRQKIASSYLFCGELGIGKKLTAVNFAKTLNCLNAQFGDQRSDVDNERQDSDLLQSEGSSELDACDACDSCMKIEAGTHPDFLLVVSEERQIRIEEIRNIADALSFKPFEGRKKIVVIDDAETMNISAANAFLKTLEEPPDDSVIILVSSKPDRLPDTIRSRCSRINFVPLSSEHCRDVLSGKVPDANLDGMTRLTMGRPGIALTDDVIMEKEWSLNLLKSMLNAEKDGWTSRDDMERWFEFLLTVIRDMAVIKITDDTLKLVNKDLSEYLAALSNSVDINAIIDIYNELNLLRSLLVFNLNKSITWNYTASLLRKELKISNA